jgi:hypothetical protein
MTRRWVVLSPSAITPISPALGRVRLALIIDANGAVGYSWALP